jgi:1,4-alpha-glucan branching enzyme
MAEPKWKTGGPEIEAIINGRHDNPFSVLGLHPLGKAFVARAFIPGAQSVAAESRDGKPLGELTCSHEAGFFQGKVSATKQQTIQFKCTNASGTWTVLDAYSIGPVLGPQDDYFMAEGNHLRLYDKLGAHPLNMEGVEGVHFAVWAPNAKRVSVVGDFNNWDGRRHVMRKRMDVGVWEIFVPDAKLGQGYKYELIDTHDGLHLKSDPYGFAAELRPNTASRINGQMMPISKPASPLISAAFRLAFMKCI